jgi:hypothetical protein
MTAKRRAMTVSIGASMVFCASTALARPCASVPVDYALTEATLVVKGWLVSTHNTGVPGSDSTSVIRVDRVLKGRTSRAEISVTHFLCGLEYSAGMRMNLPLIVFVTASGGLVSGTAVLPASRRIGEISSDARANLRAELLLGSTDEDPIVIRAAVGALAELDRAAAVATLRQSATNDDLGVRVRALTWLTRFGDMAAFRQIANMLSEWPFRPFAIPSTIHDDLEASLVIAHDDVTRALSSFAEREFNVSTAPLVSTTEFVELMTTVAYSNDINIRRAAFEALRGFKHRASFPVLVGALDDRDEYIRYGAMFTLCMAMGAPDLPCPAVSLFQADEQKYIGRIRGWWNAQQ